MPRAALSSASASALIGVLLDNERCYLPSDLPPPSTHQHRVLTVVCAIECRQQLPAFRREPRNLSVSDVAKHFRGPMVQSLRVRRGRNAKRNAKPLAMGVLPARSASRTANWFAAARKACRIARTPWRAVKGSSAPAAPSGRQGRSYAGHRTCTRRGCPCRCLSSLRTISGGRLSRCPSNRA